MSTPDAVGDVRAREQSLYRAMIRQDFPALDQLLADDLTYVHSTGVAESKAEYLSGVRKGLYDYETIESREPVFRIHGDFAVMNGVVDMRVGARGKPRDLIHLLFSLIWVRQHGIWRLAFRQATRMSDG